MEFISSMGGIYRKDNYTSSNYLYNGIIIGNDVTKPGFKIKTYDITNTDASAA